MADSQGQTRGVEPISEVTDEAFIFEAELSRDEVLAANVRFQLVGYAWRNYDSLAVNADGTVTHAWERDGVSGMEVLDDHPFAHFAGALTARFTGPQPDEPWFYLSFCDGELPKGQQFLGGAYIQGKNAGAAVGRSHKLGVNPGGEVSILGPLTADEMDENVPVADRERLLTRAEVER
jgi:hypothetical protein